MASTLFVERAQTVLGGRLVLLGRLAVPTGGGAVVLFDAATDFVQETQHGLGPGMVVLRHAQHPADSLALRDRQLLAHEEADELDFGFEVSALGGELVDIERFAGFAGAMQGAGELIVEAQFVRETPDGIDASLHGRRGIDPVEAHPLAGPLGIVRMGRQMVASRNDRHLFPFASRRQQQRGSETEEGPGRADHGHKLIQPLSG